MKEIQFFVFRNKHFYFLKKKKKSHKSGQDQSVALEFRSQGQ